MSYAMSIGLNLKRIRTRLNLTQGQLADNADLSLNQVSRIERGTAKPELETIKKLAKALHCSADELIFDDGDYIISDELRLLFSAVEDLSEDKQQMIKDFIEAMVMKSDVEKWVNKTHKENITNTLKDEVRKNHAPEKCKECGGKMKEEELNDLEVKAGIISVFQCTKCERKELFTASI